MSNELAVAALSKKITSLEAFEAALLEGKIINGSLARHTTSGAYGVRSALSAGENITLIAVGSFSFHGAEVGGLYRIHDAYRARVTDYVPMHLWWLVRERLRMVFGVYPPATSMIERINSMNATFPYAVHVSTVDPTKIAYTLSEQDGIADRQLSTTIGKFLKKHLIVLSDEEVQMVDAAHRADLSNELEIVTGAAQIQEVYTNMIGDSGCMRYSPSHFSLPDDLHPSIVYDAPGVGVAVLRDGEGNVKARSVVYVNPNNPNDKRYVRLYGDSMLKRRLERNGFECKTLLGVTLRAVPHPKFTDNTGGERIIAPYIDGAGGNTGQDGRYGVLTDEGIMMVSPDDARELQRIHGSQAAVYMIGTSGVYAFKKVAADWFMETSPLTGVKYDARKVSRVKAFLPDGRAEMVPEGEIDQATWKLYMTYNITRSGQHERVWGQSNLPTFQQYGETYVDTEAQRVALGWVRLCADFYPNEQEWIRPDSDEHVSIAGDKLIRRKDAAIVVTKNADGVQAHNTMHHAQVPEGLTQVWGFNSMRVFAGEGVEVHVTPSKRKVVPGLHEVVKMYDGVYDFRRNTKQVRVFGHELIVPRQLDMYDVDVTKAVQLLSTVGAYARRPSRDEAIRYLRMMLTRSHYSYVFREERWEGQYGTSALVHSNDLANVLATKAKFDTLTDDEIAAIASSNCTSVASIKWWINSAAALVNKFNELVAEHDAARDAASSMATVDTTNVDSLISSRFSTARFSLAA